jgi:non-canonical purine NTP pyrophosphatase (RdgB/HAM1 family)
MVVTFITGNPKKAEYLERLLGLPIKHRAIDLPERQSLDLSEIVHHKVLAAYEQVREPVLVEDVGLFCPALGDLPGPLIKWFLDALTLEEFCRLFDGKDRAVTARSCFGYFDGHREQYWYGELDGQITKHPSQHPGFGWDPIMIPNGFDIPRNELSPIDDEATYRQLKPIAAIKEFLEKE